MNDYFRTKARQNDSSGVSKCVIASKDGALVGYLCWNNAAVTKTGLDPADARGLPGYPLPAILISRLAVDKTFQGQGIAGEMLRWAFEKAVALSNDQTAPGFRFIFVDAIDENAERFYKKYGFKPFIDKPSSLYISIETIKKAGAPAP